MTRAITSLFEEVTQGLLGSDIVIKQPAGSGWLLAKEQHSSIHLFVYYGRFQAFFFGHGN